MSTFGWVHEGAVERFWEGRPDLFSSASSSTVYRCSRCGMTFRAVEELQHHFSLAHPLELPALYVRGTVLSRESDIRSPVREDDIELMQCSRCEIQRDGGSWQSMTVAEFRRQFTRPTNATWSVRLIHERTVDTSQATETHFVRFRIPDAATLNAVDELFLRTLVRDELQHADLREFEVGLPQDAPAREYGSALGNYALGVLLKERRKAPYAPVEFAEFASKMREALETLRLFSRPVAVAVCSSICFNLNNFQDYDVADTTEIAPALRFFHGVTGTGGAAELRPLHPVRQQPPVIHRICPVDAVSYRLLVTCAHLASGGALTVVELDSLRDLIDGSWPISQQDLAKVHVLCAEGYFRVARITNALNHLRAIQFDASFRDWAQHRLEEV